jgi:bifunctional non-homologous end joining protein LigD
MAPSWPMSSVLDQHRQQQIVALGRQRRNSVYEPGLRTGAWMKMRVNRAQEFVIGGYTRGTKTFDGLIFRYYKGEKLIYVARTRNGFTRVTLAQLFKKFIGRRRHTTKIASQYRC